MWAAGNVAGAERGGVIVPAGGDDADEGWKAWDYKVAVDGLPQSSRRAGVYLKRGQKWGDVEPANCKYFTGTFNTNNIV